jgi:hypothetical protein
MKTNSLTKLLIAIATFLFFESSAQNVGINADGSAPNTSAMLDIDVSALDANSKKGLLIPRVSLQSTSDQTTIPTPATGLLVYNTNASITSGNGTGFYYFNGTSWVSLSGSGSSSGTGSNANTLIYTVDGF